MAFEGIERYVHAYRSGHATKRQLAADPGMSGVHAFDLGRCETCLRMALSVQEIAGQRGGVPLRVAKVEAREWHRNVELRAAPVVAIETERAGTARNRAHC